MGVVSGVGPFWGPFLAKKRHPFGQKAKFLGHLGFSAFGRKILRESGKIFSRLSKKNWLKKPKTQTHPRIGLFGAKKALHASLLALKRAKKGQTPDPTPKKAPFWGSLWGLLAFLAKKGHGLGVGAGANLGQKLAPSSNFFFFFFFFA